MRATQSLLLYGAEVCADALDKEVHRKRLAQVQRRGASQVASDYRTVSEQAVMVIAGVIPVALLANERKAIYRRKGEHLREVVAREERQRTVTEWQLSWQSEHKLDPWLNRTHGEIDYFLIQLHCRTHNQEIAPSQSCAGKTENLHAHLEVFSLTCTGLGRRDLLIMCFAMEWRTTLNTPFSLARGQTAFISRDTEECWQLESYCALYSGSSYCEED